MDAGVVKRLLELEEKERKEMLKTLGAIETIQKEVRDLQAKIENIKQQINDKENRIRKLAENLPEFIRGEIKGTKTDKETKTGNRRKSKYVVYKDGQPVGKSLKEVFQEVYGKPVSWKYDSMIDYLRENGYDVKVE